MAVHVFVDSSNIFHGAQAAAAKLEPEAVEPAVRVYYRNLFWLLENGRDVATRVLAGSVTPSNRALWDYARDAGYDTHLLRLVEHADGSRREQAVDELLHLQIANCLLDHEPPQTLVLATGDGSDTELGGSFPRQVERALDRDWHVEVWSWKDQLSSAFAEIDVDGRGCEIHHLDGYYRGITFVQAGEYHYAGVRVRVEGRVVASLPNATADTASAP